MSESEVQKLICIGCPMGCHLEVEHLEGGGWTSRGYQCRTGKDYAIQEVTDPRRMVTTTVEIKGARWKRLPVRTASAIPRDQVMDVCRALHQVTVEAPIRVGDVVLSGVLDTGIDIIATRSM